MKDFWERLVDRYKKIDPEQMEQYLRSLAREKGLLQSVFESISEAIIVLDRDRKIVFINNTARGMLGITNRSPVNKPILRYVTDLRLQKLFDDDDLFTRSTFSTEFRIKRPRKMVLQINIFPYRMDSELEGSIVLIKDITQQKKKQMDTFQSEKLSALSTLAAGVAHEIGNPLNSIGIHMQLMDKDIKKIKDKKTRDRLTEYIRSARTEVTRLDKMVRTFLTAVRPTALNLTDHNINHILEGVLDFLYYEISDKNIAIEKEYSPKVPLMPLDEEQIRQAFFNIIKNAIEAMPNGGQLRVASDMKQDEVIVAFTDTGGGITEENLSQIFEPYFTTKQKGSGLGLMIVYKIISDHGGRIEVESDKGKGTLIKVFLPIFQRKVRMVQDKTKKGKE